MPTLTIEQLRDKINEIVITNFNRKISALKMRSLLTDFVDTIENEDLKNAAWQIIESGGTFIQPATPSMQLKLTYLTRLSALRTRILVVSPTGFVTAITPQEAYNLRGTVATRSSFPDPETVQDGDTYEIAEDVTDDDPTRTNTGMAFVAGDKIYWLEATWMDYKELVFDVSDVTEGITITKNGISKGVFGIKTLIEEGETLTIPLNYEYNCTSLEIDGDIELEGDINFI